MEAPPPMLKEESLSGSRAEMFGQMLHKIKAAGEVLGKMQGHEETLESESYET